MAKPLGRLMISALPQGIDADVIIPVPLHPTRLRAREFNQSLLLADQLSRHLARPVSATNLVRTSGIYIISPRKSVFRFGLAGRKRMEQHSVTSGATH